MDLEGGVGLYCYEFLMFTQEFLLNITLSEKLLQTSFILKDVDFFCDDILMLNILKL